MSRSESETASAVGGGLGRPVAVMTPAEKVEFDKGRPAFVHQARYANEGDTFFYAAPAQPPAGYRVPNRKQFEAWYAREWGISAFRLHNTFSWDGESYNRKGVQASWVIWQAAQDEVIRDLAAAPQVGEPPRKLPQRTSLQVWAEAQDRAERYAPSAVPERPELLRRLNAWLEAYRGFVNGRISTDLVRDLAAALAAPEEKR